MSSLVTSSSLYGSCPLLLTSSMATFTPSTALMPSCWSLPDRGPWNPTLIVPPAGLPTPAPLPHCAWGPPPEPLSLLLHAVRTSGITMAPTARDTSRRFVDSRTCCSPRGGPGVWVAPSGRTLGLAPRELRHPHVCRNGSFTWTTRRSGPRAQPAFEDGL